MLAWDLRPMRPWEYWDADASEWMIAKAVEREIQNGFDDANAEHREKGREQ